MKTKTNEMEYSFSLVKPFDTRTNKFSEAINMKNSIFLAGPCPRVDYESDWRFKAYEILTELGFQGNVITPTNDLFSYAQRHVGNALLEQTKWERIMMHMASAIVFWVPRSNILPGFTTNVEFGEWYKKPGIFFGYPESADKMQYLELKFQEMGKKSYHDLRTLLTDVVESLTPSTSGRKYFTADTHFGQQRTLELSRRPFVDIVEMDLTMISNWNKTVAPNGIVYHAGDFIDPEKLYNLPSLLSNLNFGKLFWVLGNYDRKNVTKIKKILDDYKKTDDREIILFDQSKGEVCETEIVNGDKSIEKFIIIHEPVDFPTKKVENVTYLYGHIHGRSFAKRNGLDMATDYHGYTPLSEDDILWFKNAMQYWDENVYSDHILTS